MTVRSFEIFPGIQNTSLDVSRESGLSFQHPEFTCMYIQLPMLDYDLNTLNFFQIIIFLLSNNNCE